MTGRRLVSPLLVPTPPEALRRQELVLGGLNLMLLAAIAGLHLVFSDALGLPSRTFFAVVMGRFLLQAVELGWLSSLDPAEGSATLVRYAASTIWVNLGFAFAISLLGGMEDSHYIALLLIPVLAAGFRATAAGVALVVAVTSTANFLQLGLYFNHVGARPTEYFEAANVALIYPVVALVVALLAAQQRHDRERLEASRDELARTRDRLVAEERLAAVGRLSAAVAHEVRNPVGMIVSSFAQLRRRHPGLDGDELAGIVIEEAARLERLTGDFLGYARRREPVRRPTSSGELLGYVAGVARAQAAERGVEIRVADGPDLELEADPFQVHQALLNLIANGIDAAAPAGAVELSAQAADGAVELVVADDGPALPESIVSRLFEPFVSGKRGGTGLGLAVSRSIAAAHGGDLELEHNADGAVRFVLRLPVPRTPAQEVPWPAS